MSATFIVPWDEFTYTPSDEDLIYLATALYGETRGNHSEEEWGRMCWTWFNRFMLKTNRPWPTLSSLIKNHSQPVNPKWRADGTFCKVGGKYHGKDNCSKNKLAWRRKMANIIASGDLSKVPSDISDVAIDFVDGKIPEPETDDGSALVDFASTPGAKKHGTQYESKGNHFLSYDQVQGTNYTSSFINDHVQVTGGGAQKMPGPLSKGDNDILAILLSLPLGVVLAKLGVALYKKYFKGKK